jgi:hypothetical protein
LTSVLKLVHPDPASTQAWGLADTDQLANADGPSSGGGQELFDLIREIRAIHGTVPSQQTITVTIPAKYVELHSEITAAISRGAPIALRRRNDIPLHSLLRFTALLSFVVCSAAVVMWLGDIPPIINPFVAILGIVASPFFYMMGEAARIKPL